MKSTNEIVSTLRKAGRGAGLDDGTAHDVAQAAARSIATGQDGLAHALALFDEPHTARALVAKADLQAAGEAVERPASPLFDHLAGEAHHGAFEVDPDLWRRALALAHETYVPATAASRAGAGAGRSDND